MELWRYLLYANGILCFEEVHGSFISKTVMPGDVVDPIRLPGEKESLQEYILSLDPNMEGVPRINHIAYQMSRNIACMEVQLRDMILVKLDPKKLGPLP